MREFLNKNLQPFYILHLPGQNNLENYKYVDECINKEIKIHNNISVISLMNQKFWDTSPLVYQCQKNNIKIYNNALDEESWTNIIKLVNIIKLLDEISTDYVLFLDGRDVCFIQDIDEKFLDLYKSFNKPIVYNGTETNFPLFSVGASIDTIIQNKNKNKYLNAGVCIGETKAMKEFYQKVLDNALSITPFVIRNVSEQFFVKMTAALYPEYVAVDDECKLFVSIHGTFNIVEEDNKVTMY